MYIFSCTMHKSHKNGSGIEILCCPVVTLLMHVPFKIESKINQKHLVW